MTCSRRLLATLLLCGCAAPLLMAGKGREKTELRHAEDLVAVDCLLPSPIRRLGRSTQIAGPRKAIKTTAVDCRIRGGEYTENRGDYAFALQVWLPQAKSGDAEAQAFVGEIYEKGPGGTPDYANAVSWYRQAAEKGSNRAAMSLGYLYEKGLGVPRDPQQAVQWYRKASGLPTELIALSGEEGSAVTPKEPPPGVADLPLAGPTIALIDPQITGTTRGMRSVALRSGVPERDVIGRLTAPAGLMSFLVNDQRQEVGPDGLFQVSVPVVPPRSGVSLVAVDRRGQRAILEFELVVGGEEAPPPSLSLPAVNWGRYHALVIGNNEYKEWPRLATAINDAKDIAALLRSKYGFTDVSLIENATRSDLMDALEEMREKLTKEDKLLIYYAGHGHLEKDLNRAYWIPVDGGLTRMSQWIQLDDVAGQLELNNAKQVLVIADSCYAGQMTRSGIAYLRQGMTDEEEMAFLKQLSDKPARLVLTSGGVQPVLDEGDGRNSVFAQELLTVLEENDYVLRTAELFQIVQARVARSAERRRYDQVPSFSGIRNSKNEGGEFLFVPQSH